MENREAEPKIKTLLKLAACLDCTVDYLLCLEDESGRKVQAPGIREEAAERLFRHMLNNQNH